MADQPSPNLALADTEPSPREPGYAVRSGLRVGPAVLELSDRVAAVRDEKGIPRIETRVVLTLAIDRDLESKAEALALAKALEVLAEGFDS